MKDLILSKYLIPWGTAHVNFLIFGIGGDGEVFEIAQGFKPESRLRKKDFVLTEAAEGFSSIPFGFEMQMCLGRRITKLELRLLFARILQQFDI